MRAETLVAKALARQGWALLARNVRHTGFELDLVARKGATLVVIEVKARVRPPTSERDMAELLPPKKRQALARGLAAAVTRWGTEVETARVDLAVVDARGSIDYHVNVL